jgi:peptide/nickel transport system substrate-binding protein
MKRRKKGTMKPRFIWILVITWILAIGGVFSGSPRDAQAAPPAGTLKQAIHWGLSADWLDPATNSSLVPSQVVLYFLHDALLKPMPDGNFSPCLAESWTISPDAKVYEFKLRQGVKFHNGDPLTAEDVIFSYWRYKAGQAKIIHDRTEKVEAVNPHLVRIRFKEPFPDFLEYLLPGATTIAWIAPKKYIEKVGEAGYKKHPIGAGPYKFVEFVPGQRLVGEAFPEFWRKSPSIKRIEIHVVSEPATRLAMAGRGEADIATLMQGVFYENLKKDGKLRMLAPPEPIAVDGLLYRPVRSQVSLVGPASPQGSEPRHRPSDPGRHPHARLRPYRIAGLARRSYGSRLSGGSLRP